MKFRYCLVTGMLAAGFTSGCNDSALDAVAAAPEAHVSCTGCHQGKRSFSGRDVGKLAENIRLIRDGKMSHPPLGLSDVSDTAIDALAVQLTGN